MVGAGSLTAEGPGRGLASCRLGSGATGPHFPKKQPGSGVSRAGGLGPAGSLHRSPGFTGTLQPDVGGTFLRLSSSSSSCDPQGGLVLQLLHKGGTGSPLSDQKTEAQVAK